MGRSRYYDDCPRGCDTPHPGFRHGRRTRLGGGLDGIFHLGRAASLPKAAATCPRTADHGASPRLRMPLRNAAAKRPRRAYPCAFRLRRPACALALVRQSRAPIQRQTRKAGFRYRLSVLQAELSLTQIWDRPRHGREFFEEVIRENIDLGRPETVQLIVARKMRRSTVAGGRCRTRIVTEGVIPSLHVETGKNRGLRRLRIACFVHSWVPTRQRGAPVLVQNAGPYLQ